MNESQLYESIGRKQAQVEQLNASYDALLSLLARVVSGEVVTSRLLVDLTNRAWLLANPGERPYPPATINGLPKCVMAQEPPIEVAVDITEM